ncbi:MAG: flavodoxin family protein [Pseudomonadales bacterium]
MKQLRIIYHSQSAHTESMAQAVLKGARQEDDVETLLLRAFDAGLDDFLAADALIFGTPEYFGYMSGALKNFFDHTFYPAQPHELNLPFALFVSTGNDGSGAISNVERIVKGYRLGKLTEPVLSVGELSEHRLVLCEELGLSMAAGTAMGIF